MDTLTTGGPSPLLRDPLREQLYAAVRYLLDQTQVNPDLGYQLGAHVRAFEQLVAAEAAYLGEDAGAVRQRRLRDLQPAYNKRRPKLLELREEQEKLQRIADAALRVAKSEPGWKELEEALRDAGYDIPSGGEG